MNYKILGLSCLFALLFSSCHSGKIPASYTTSIEEIKKVEAPFEMQTPVRPVFKKEQYNILDYGAVEGGEVKNTSVITSAVAACSKNGGGTVIIPDGKWLTGPIHLQSNVHLHLCEQAELHFSDHFEDYLPLVLTRWEGMECYNYSPLIYAFECENIAITGKGKLFGHGQKWWKWKKIQNEVAANKLNEQCAAGIPVQERRYGIEGGLRAQFIQPFRCKNVLIEGITLINGPFWTIHPVYCENIIVRKVTIDTHGPNTDGLNFDSCKTGLVEESAFHTGDDCVCLKSGINEDGWRVNKPCENIVIRNCTSSKGHGVVVMGSEMSGGIQNIYAHDMVIQSNDRPIRLKSMRGRGGYIKNVYFRNFKVKEAKKALIQINMKYAWSTVVPKTKKAPIFEDIYIEQIECETAKAGYLLTGLEEQPIRNVQIKNVRIHEISQRARQSEFVDGLKEENCSIPYQSSEK